MSQWEKNSCGLGQDLRSKDELRQFVEGQDDKVLTVVNVSVTAAAPCIRIFPAVLALARNFQVQPWCFPIFPGVALFLPGQYPG